MRIRNGLGVLICCCAGIAACTAAPTGLPGPRRPGQPGGPGHTAKPSPSHS